MAKKKDSLYGNVEKNLRFLVGSNLRNRILLALRSGVKNLKDLKNETGSNASTIIHSIRDMEKENMIMEKEDGYHLTSIGDILGKNLLNLVETIYVLKKHQDFWLNHDISGIPHKFLDRINELNDYEIITSSLKNVWRTYSIYFELISKAREFRGVSPIFHPGFPQMIEKLTKNKIATHLVITDEILSAILQSLTTKKKYELREIMTSDRFGIWITESTPKAAFTVTDSLLSLSLFLKDGTFDTTKNLISKNNEAIKWGRELFSYYHKDAQKIEADQIQ